jgi:hypothetical protein
MLERVRTSGRSLAHHPWIGKQSSLASNDKIFVSYTCNVLIKRVDMVPVKREPDSSAKGPSPEVWAARQHCQTVATRPDDY